MSGWLPEALVSCEQSRARQPILIKLSAMICERPCDLYCRRKTRLAGPVHKEAHFVRLSRGSDAGLLLAQRSGDSVTCIGTYAGKAASIPSRCLRTGPHFQIAAFGQRFTRSIAALRAACDCAKWGADPRRLMSERLDRHHTTPWLLRFLRLQELTSVGP